MTVDQTKLAKLLWHIQRSRLYSYRPYPKQYEFHAAGKTKPLRLLLAGNQLGKCATANTPIDTPSGPVRLGELYRRGRPFTCHAWDGEKVVVTLALAPFEKPGLHECYRITMADGRWVEVADEHRLWLDGAWVFARQLVCAHGPLGSNSDVPSQSAALYVAYRDQGESRHALPSLSIPPAVSPPAIAASPAVRSDRGVALQAPLVCDGQTGPLGTPFLRSVDIASIMPIGSHKVYDFTVPGLHNYIAGGLVNHNTLSAGAEFAMHMIGWYPDWWPGIKFDRPIDAWACAVSTEKQREILQKILYGTERASKKSNDFGTGMIPFAEITDVSNRQAGVSDVIDQVRVRFHKSKRESAISHKVYEQGRRAYEGKPVPLIWDDEEPGGKEGPGIFSEQVARGQTIPDSRLMMTFTPLLGMTEIVRTFMQESQHPDSPYHVTNMTIYDAVGGVWPEGTPWAGEEWDGHYSKEQADAEVAKMKPYERDTRAYGIPMMGEGRVFPVADDEIAFDVYDFPKGLPHWWPRIIGIDFGIGHPFAMVFCAWDRDNDVLYVYDAYRKEGETTSQHATVLRSRPDWDWIPVAWPHDGHQRDKGSGKALTPQYRAAGFRMMAESARFDDESGGPQSTEQSNDRLLDRMMSGRLKVARQLSQVFEEIRSYHRENNVVVASRDDLIRAMGYAEMELRHAKTAMPRARRKPRYTRPIVGGRAA